VSKIRSPEVAAKRAARERQKRRKSLLLLIGVLLLMIGALVTDFLFIRAYKRFHHLRHHHPDKQTNSQASTNLRTERFDTRR
jgi:hypothetical protein